jgi:predicted GNAT family acetyltransferase
LDRDRVANVMVAARVKQVGLDPWRLGAEMWGHPESGEVRSLCFSGANLVPIAADDEALAAFAERARNQGRRCSSIVGDAHQVLALWDLLQPSWGRARDIRDEQPLMAISRPPAMEGNPEVRLVRGDELDLFLPAAIAMYIEEIGFSPVVTDGGALYRARIRELIEERHAFGLIRDGQVLFKAEIGAVAGDTCQIQGVWVDPSLRGQGLGSAGTAAVVTAAQRDIAPVVSLYVNARNVSARRIYERVGFQIVGQFASVLF